MGLGGALMWTALFNNVRQDAPGRRLVVIHRQSWRQWLRRQRHPDHMVYEGNRDIDLLCSDRVWPLLRHAWRGATVVDTGDPRFTATASDSRERQPYRTGAHTVQLFCDAAGIPCRSLRPRLWLSPAEIDTADALLAESGLSGRRFLCIEPFAKESFTPNKSWLPERWQGLVDRLRATGGEDVAIVQVGAGEQAPLQGVIDLTGRLGFRATARILERACGLVTTMGGLVHLNKAVGGRAVVLISGFEPLEIASYPDDVNLYHRLDCSNCGLKIPCPVDRACMRALTVDGVAAAVDRLLAGNAR